MHSKNLLHSIRNRLILLYTCSTGLILTAVLIFVAVITDRQLERNQINSFQNNYITINQNIQSSSEISNLWMAEMETKNYLIIHIEDNGSPFLFQGSWKSPTDRNTLVDKVKELAAADNINTGIRPISLKELQSNIYPVKGDKNDKYLGEVFLAPVKEGFRSVIVLQYISNSEKDNLKQKLVLVLLGLAGIAALFLVSRQMVSKALKPVEESRRRQTEFIAAASHELKSPLAVIRANASALMLAPERAGFFTTGIEKECKRLAALIEDMLLLASADARTWKIKKEVLDLDTLLIEVYDLFYSYCKEQGKELKLILPDTMLPRAEGDGERIKQILAVLIDNAVTYTSEKDTICLRGHAKKNRIYLEVEDHGAGISQEKKVEIFERFYREDKSRKDKNHFGLGLSIAKELSELNGGSITVTDTKGGGATFIVSLPVYK
ncbi:HAMP domain-containing sensor histidine kinase [Anaerocolumna sp. AGMB13025]|uniref:sensor histidine kinase n=1 Tax=Anaerocolumna sp. AGMB13025 TaxID=3039116 RepID=UPI00241F3ECF|nr:HAMP domain-containing sensor histidine kinase [Anaerocolumna sp. AGMB13025]WFR56540.1 HAMP domain-containing sensor histidine kinase [Anaerocolumna sp. AGMB13025]